MNGTARGGWAMLAAVLLHGGLWWVIPRVQAPGEPSRPIPVVLQVVPKPPVPRPRPERPLPKRARAQVKPLPQRALSPAPMVPSRPLPLAPNPEVPQVTQVATAEPQVADDAVVPEIPETGATSSVQAGLDPDGVAHDSYLARILAMIEGRVEYPLQARRMRWEGQTRLRCTLARDGTVRDVVVETSSGYRLLDMAAMRAIQQAGPFPPLPEAIAGETVLLSVPVSFRLEN